MPIATLLTLMFASVGHAQAASPTVPDTAAIVRTALDYIEGFYTGDAARMERALYPELAKRIFYPPREAGGKPTFDHMGALRLIMNTRAMTANPVPKERQQKDVSILDIYQNAAMVKIVAATWVDYLQMARVDGAWKIVNVLWELKPRS
jgi:hypothetical protein